MLVAMKLRAGRHGKAGADRKAFRRGKPGGTVLEGGVLTRTLRVEAESPQIAGVFSQRVGAGAPSA
jgi:hypothetical protein